MNAAEQSQFWQVLHDRCDVITDRWYTAIAETGFAPRNAVRVRQCLFELTEQAIALLLTEPFDYSRAQAMGVSLARLHDYIQPEALGKTQEALARWLFEDLLPDQVVALQPRLAALLGGLAVGFFQQARQRILAEQEQIRRALINERKRAEEALQQAHDELERRVEERTAELAKANEELQAEITERKQAEEEREKLIVELQEALTKIKTLRGLIPICAHCKKIRDDQGYWNQLEAYIQDHSEAEFSHGICDECMTKWYPELFRDDKTRRQEGDAMEHILNAFITANETPYRSWTERHPGRQAVGCLCTYTPEEVIHAAGFTPVRIRTGPELPTQAEAHLQSFTCALCRSVLHQALQGDLAFLSGLVFPHTCDTLQVLADVWRENFPNLFVDTVVQPLNLGSPNARPYLVAELQRFRRGLAGLGQPISDDSLRASIRLHNETRRLLSQLDNQRSHLTARGFYTVIDASMVMPKEEFNPLAAELVELLNEKNNQRQRGPRLILVGPVLDDLTVLDIIDDLDACVVGDDLCTGSRYFDQPATENVGQACPEPCPEQSRRDSRRIGNLSRLQSEEGNPIEALADRYLKRQPCPTKHKLHAQRGEYLLGLVEERKADGLVFILQKFCDPHAFDYAIAKGTLDAAGVPHLLLELEHTPAVGQLRTRLEAFLEMLKA